MMLKHLSRYSTIILAVLAMSYALPAGFDKIFGTETGSTLLFFSPIKKLFLYKQSSGGHRLQYFDEQGKSYSRRNFEEQLPFLYYKDLEVKGMLPIEIEGQRFDKKAIKAGKQGLEIKSRHLQRHYPQIELYPLFNNDPDKAMLAFPKDMFRITNQAMEFINADSNSIDQELTNVFTKALQEQNFIFPATVIGGKTTNLKPFDDGYFIRDSSGQVFHVMRIKNKPQIIKTSISAKTDVVAMMISENKRKEFYGIIVTRQGDLYLISHDNYRLIELPVEKYQPGSMDFKLLINPMFKTLVTSGPRMVYGTAMNSDYQSFHSYELGRHNPTPLLFRVSRDLLFPFQLRFDNPYRGQVDLRLQFGGFWSLVGILLALALFILVSRKKEYLSVNKGEVVLVLMTGFFGLIALFCNTKD